MAGMPLWFNLRKVSAVNRRYAEMFLTHSYIAANVTFINCAKVLEGGTLGAVDEYVPQSLFLGLLGTGDGSCVASRGSMALEGRVSDVGACCFSGYLFGEEPSSKPARSKAFFYGVATCICSYQYLWDLKDWIDRKWMYNYTGGLPTMDDDESPRDIGKFQMPRHANNPVAASVGPEALAVLDAAPMRCGGCGAKVKRSAPTRG